MSAYLSMRASVRQGFDGSIACDIFLDDRFGKPEIPEKA